MKLYEYMAKDIFQSNGIAVPQGSVFTNSAAVADYVKKIGPVALKSQILSGGRGKAGGIAFADTPDDAVQRAEELLSLHLKGLKVNSILVEEKMKIDQEIYLAITYDRSKKCPILLASKAGGMEIEEVTDSLLIKQFIDINVGLSQDTAHDIAARLGLTENIAEQAAQILSKLYQVFRSYDAELVEINPLIISKGQVIAADGKITLDDEASFRYKPNVPIVEERTPIEIEARELGISYVELNGDIGVMANGAGITMTTLDLIEHFGGQPRNFMDAGGGSSVKATASALKILLSTKPQALLINIFGGITRCDDVASAFVQVKNTMEINIPVVIRLVGTNDQKGIEILRSQGIDCFQDIDLAVKRVVELAREKAGRN